jgi:polar amino acid transport system substrate-binding protein
MYASTDKGENMKLMHRLPPTSRYNRLARASLASLLVLLAASPLAAAGTLERIKDTGKLNLGYGGGRPFSYQDDSGKPAGFAVSVCDKVADALKSELGLPSLSVNYVQVTRKEGIGAVAAGKIDLLCDATVPTLAARKEVSFSIPIFASGVAAVVRSDASTRLKDVLSGRVPPTSPLWRGNADVLLRESTLSVVPGTRAELALSARIGELKMVPKIVPVSDNAAGIAAVLDGRSNVFFAERATLLDSVKRGGSTNLQVLDRFFTRETLALAVARGDEDFRLAVDTALSGLYRSNEFRDVYSKSFGEMKDSTLSLFRAEAPPE